MRIVLGNYENENKTYAEFISYYFLCFMMFTICKRLMGNSGSATMLSALISFPILLWKGVCSSIYLFRKTANRLALSYFGLTAIYIICMLKGIPIAKVLEYYLSASIGVFLFWNIVFIDDFEELWNVFLKYSYIIFGLSLLIIFVNRDVTAYSMRYSYLLSVILFMHTMEVIFRDKKYSILVAVELFLILFYGSRGPIACYLFFCVLTILTAKSKYIIKIFSVLGAVGFYKGYELLGKVILSFLNKYNIKSRTLYLLFKDIEHTSGRDIIQEKAIVMIREKPILGWGIMGEYLRMDDYPHNIIIELCLDFGGVLGIVIFSILIIMVIYTVRQSEGYVRKFMFIFISFGLVTLFFSSSYLTWDGFFILLGLMGNILRRQKNESTE